MTEVVERDHLEKKIEVLKEHISSQEDMLNRTTSFMSKIQTKLEESKAALQEKNNEIFDSLRYAERLQTALKPSCSTFQRAFRDSFLYLKQRDIIGGDFSYLAQTETHWYVAAADCTGHGIPGAMLSMMAHSMLNEIILQMKISHVGQILTHLNQMLRNTLHTNENRIKDGLDIGLCKIDKSKTTLHYAGARRPLFHVPNGSLNIIKGSRVSVGEKPGAYFEVNEIALNGKDKIYLFSDGIVDQFGGPNNKKFGSKQLRSLIQNVKDLNMRKQAEIIINTHELWRKQTDQTDDILMLGICI